MMEGDIYILYTVNIERALSPDAEYEVRHILLQASRGILLNC